MEGARRLTGGDGEKLIDHARRLAHEGVTMIAAQKRLLAIAKSFLEPSGAARAATAAWVIAGSAHKAMTKLGEGYEEWLFDSDGLQMASGVVTAAYHAQLLKDAGADLVVDTTAGIGADTFAFARAGMTVIAYEREPARAALLAANAERLGLSEQVRVICGDSAARMPPDGAFLFCDPPRRTKTSRWGNQAETEDILKYVLASGAPGALVKLSPAAEREIGARTGGALEYIGVDGECREALVRYGAVAASAPSALSAVLLPKNARLSSDGKALEARSLSPTDASYLYEPDAAVIRAGLVPALAQKSGMALIDPEIAYLLSAKPVEMPFARGYHLLAAMPYHKKAVQSWLEEHKIGSLVVKKRGVPNDPETVRNSFKLRGSERAILALARQGKRVWAMFMEIAGSE